MKDRDSLEASKIFNEYAEYYVSRERENPNRKKLFKVIKKILKNTNGKKVLDVGCGGGTTSRWLAKNGATVIGSDISDKMIEIARINCIDTDANFFVSDMEDMGLPDNEFDVVLANFSIMYKKNLDDILKELTRVLKGRGELVIVVPHPVRKMVKYTGDYFKDGKHWEKLGKMKIFGYYRTVEDYVSSIMKSGFAIKELREMKSMDKKSVFTFPEYLLIRATKTNQLNS